MLLLWVLWLLLAGRTDAAEWTAGGGAALLGALALHVVSTARLAHFKPRALWMVQAWHVPVMVIRDLGIVLAVLMTRLRGGPHSGFLRAPFDVHGDRDEVATRGALVVALLTASPNSIVLDVQGDGELVMHQLQRQPLPAFVHQLGVLP